MAILALVLIGMLVQAQEHQHHEEAAAPQELGSVSFPISCSASDQRDFNRGMALLHSFSYKNARIQFQQISQRDSACAMSYWGEAMSLYHQLWDRPAAKELDEGFRLLQRAQAVPIPTDRERGYIGAAAKFYNGDPAVSYESRRAAYSAALGRLHELAPKDDEASLFYALSHMPSHIFARLGMWDDDIQSNLASVKIAGEQKAFPDMLHAMNFLEYAYLQKGEFDEAKHIETRALAVPKGELGDMAGMYNYVRVRFPSLYLLETKDWVAAQSMPVPSDAEPDFQAVVYWTRAIASGHLRNRRAAATAVAGYDAKLEEVRKSTYAYLAESMERERDEAHAWLAFAQGKTKIAVTLLSAAAEKQDREGKGEVELPAREMLADVLSDAGHPMEARTQYQQCLRTDPNRLNSLRGAQRAEQMADR